MPTLARFVPPAKTLDKHVYSPWTEGRLDAMLSGSGIDTLIITGGETDVCVLATVLGAIDRGYRVVLVTDAICSSADQTHDALMELYRSRFFEQVEAVSVEEVLSNWR
jgi:nicotinamidase-related amidase